MYRFLCCCAVLIVAVNAGEPELKCPVSSSQTTAYRLRSELLCDYNSFLRPVKDHRNATIFEFKLLLKYFQYDHFTHRLSVDSWFHASWIDEHLKWKPEEYEGIKSIHLSTGFDIWAPDISIYNMKDQSTDPKMIEDVTCTVNYQGMVFCIPPVHFEALCVPNLTKYPYDTQECTIRFGSWVHKGEELFLKPVGQNVNTDDLEANGEWELVKTKTVYHRGNYSCCPNNTYPSIDITFEIKRNSHTHAINVVLPLIVCILITISSMAMSPLNKDRFILSCVSVITHIFHIQNVSYTIPITGEDLPSLLTISRDSTLLAGVSVIVAILLKNMMENRNQSPAWVTVTASVLIGSRPGQLIFLTDNTLKGAAAAQKQEDGDTIISNVEIPGKASNASDWAIFAKFLDVLLFITYLLIYFIILCGF